MAYSQNLPFDRFISVAHSPIFFVNVILFCAFSYFFLDQTITLYTQHTLSATWRETAEVITDFGKSTPYYILFSLSFIFFKFILKKKAWENIFLFLLFSIFIPGIICTTLKVILARMRPVHYLNDQAFGFTFFSLDASHLSFPSGHSTLITSLMIALSFLFPKYWKYFTCVFIIISLSRVVVGAHYLSDIVAGMYLAILAVPWVYQKFQKNRMLCPISNEP